MDPDYKAQMEKQGYYFAGNHSAVKICEWTRNTLRGEGWCYKHKFYDIQTHRCVQMSTFANFCNMDCVFCWRERNNSPPGEIDEPEQIISASLEGQKLKLNGFKGNPKVVKELYEESLAPMHFAISLTGESILYPKMNEFLKQLHAKKITSFLVTNGLSPELMEKIEPPTQLYVSMSASNEKDFLEIDKPMGKDAWNKYLKSLDVLKKRKKDTRTVIRMAIIKKLNMKNPKEYGELIMRAEPDFVEVKSYMFVGASRERLKIENMPFHEDILEFAKELEKYTDYKITDEHEQSRCVLMTNKNSKERFIKFETI